MQDAWRAYTELALGLTAASTKKATTVAKRLIGTGGATAEQIQALAEEIIRSSTTNREALARLIRHELDRALAVVGLATSDEVAGLQARVRELEERLREAETRAGAAATTAGAAGVAEAPRTAVAKKIVAKKTVAKKTVAKKTGETP